MAWPPQLVYGDGRQGVINPPPSPFAVRMVSDPLRVVVDPDSALDPIVEAYFAMLERRNTSERDDYPLIHPHLNDGRRIDIVEIDSDPISEERQDVWRISSGPALDANQVGDPTVDGVYTIRRSSGGRYHQHYSYSHVGSVARLMAKKNGISFNEALRARLSYEIALVIKADILVTTTEPWGGWQRSDLTTVCTPSQAMAAIGLYQRLHGRLDVIDGVDRTFVLWQAERLAAEAYVPSLRNLAEEGPPNSRRMRTFQGLRGSIHHRIARVLHDRDHLLAHHVVRDRPLFYDESAALVEQISLNLSGAFDALARVLKLMLDSPEEFKYPSFLCKSFSRKLDPRVREKLRKHQVRLLLGVIAQLRNTIHNEALSSGTTGDGRSQGQPVAYIPVDDIEKFREAYCKLGGLADLVVDDPHLRYVHDFVGIRSQPFMDEIIRRSLAAFEDILQVAPWHSGGLATSWCKDPSSVDPQMRELYGL